MFIFFLKTGMILYRIEGVYMYDLGVQFHFSLEQAKSNPAAIIKGNNYRFTILSERLIRIEYSSNGMFVDNPTQLVLCRNFNIPKFDVKQDSKYLEITTKYFKLSYTKETQITSSSLRISLIGTENMWYYEAVMACARAGIDFHLLMIQHL